MRIPAPCLALGLFAVMMFTAAAQPAARTPATSVVSPEVGWIAG